MPIYEFYCPDCHTVFSFFSASVDTESRPACPRCGRPELGRRPSRFATLKGGGAASGDEEGDSPIPGLDEQRMERAMEQLAGEMGDLGGEENPDPRQLARFMRRFGEVSGLEPGPKLEEMLRQLESGADPDSLDEDPDFGGGGDGEMDDAAAFAELFKSRKEGGKAARSGKPRIDETLHFL